MTYRSSCRTWIASENEITPEKVIAAFAEVAFNGVARFVRVNGDGDPVIDLSRCSETDLNRLAEITIDDVLEGRGEDSRTVRKIKIKPHDRMAALDKLARHLGLLDADNNRRLAPSDALTELLMQINKAGSKAPMGN